ncbi:MAG TPA: DUF4349 domain-containing protein [Planctomycetaceae bacterium]|nr:DUF4349 domain-containing protein [Planctomycetaceae bacterium]
MQLASCCAVLFTAAIAFLGCGGEYDPTVEYPGAKSGSAAIPPQIPAREAAGEQPAAAAGPGEQAPPDGVPAPVRRVIYNATLDLAVSDIAGVGETIARLVADAGGYISQSSIRGTSGSRRSASWTVRVPVEGFDAFLREASRLGEVNSLSTTSQEVTAEFYDVEARLRNKRQEEQRMLAILESDTGKLEDVLRVETEISRVRQEIERLDGRLRLLQDLTALSTVTVHVSEIREFVATTPGDFPTFGERVSSAWHGTLATLRDVGQQVVILAVAAAPWVLVLALPTFVLYRILRRLGRPARRMQPGQKAA